MRGIDFSRWLTNTGQSSCSQVVEQMRLILMSNNVVEMMEYLPLMELVMTDVRRNLSIMTGKRRPDQPITWPIPLV